MHILVTGGAGYIGSACVNLLIKDGHSVVVFDDLSTGQSDKVSPEAVIVAGSVTDAVALENLFSRNKFDAVLHFAAKKAVGESEDNPSLYFDTNVVGSINLLKTLVAHSVPKIVFSSTAAVYAPSEDGALFTEVSNTVPASVYGTTKLMVEDMIQSYARTGKLKHFSILRYFNVAGDAGLDYREESAQNVFPIIARTIKSGEEFSILGTDYGTKDGTCVRDYIHLKDLVEAHILALTSDQNGIYNLGTGTGYSVRELVESFNQQLDTSLKVKECPRRAGDSPIVLADTTLAQKEWGWRPKHTLSEMVEDTLRVYGK